jgi:hypothetical protein
MSDTRFLAIADEFKSRIEHISVDNGYFTNLGESVYLEGLQPIPMDDKGLPLKGSVVVDPGEIDIPEGLDTRMVNGVMVEALFSREVRVVAAIDAGDKDKWLQNEERVGRDMRRSIGRQPESVNDNSVKDWRQLGVKEIAQVGQRSGRADPGSNTQFIEIRFRLRYVES